ncbi:MAG: low molecular weight phosphotyrosine protein phosphatase [Chitinophagales bacterium]|nr:low molecular weight phosphotyrosine protein phosphatase [Bacteroidota bacterium]MCB9257564.1 low molecular weight phosphotyrosine protein phosphatase [Chitinophagales bacterium]
MSNQLKILMVCLGNICRSPLAEGILKHKVQERNLNWEVDSAGTSGFHAGEKPDRRSIAEAKKHQIDISEQRSRQFRGWDLESYDLIYVMDNSNLRDVLSLAKNEEEKAKVILIMNELEPGSNINVPDPYYGEYGFENVYSMLDKACEAIINKY